MENIATGRVPPNVLDHRQMVRPVNIERDERVEPGVSRETTAQFGQSTDTATGSPPRP